MNLWNDMKTRWDKMFPSEPRGRIEEIAANIFHITPEWVSGPVSIWADDIDDPPLTCALTREIIPLMGGVRCDLGLVS